MEYIIVGLFVIIMVGCLLAPFFVKDEEYEDD